MPKTLALSELTLKLRDNGLEILGFFDAEQDECLIPDRSIQPKAIAIVGNVGSEVWPFFQRARRDRPDLSLDRWTREVVDHVAGAFGIDAVYPFEGPPFHPFIRWARRTGALFSSPIGLTIHPTHGLWIAFRAALLIDRPLDPEGQPVPPRHHHPCESCADRPCLTTCPVGAFTDERYDFEACVDHLATSKNACREGGCLARVACPVGRDHRYQQPHASFHMEQLLKAHGCS